MGGRRDECVVRVCTYTYPLFFLSRNKQTNRDPPPPSLSLSLASKTHPTTNPQNPPQCLQHTLFGINLPRQHAQFFSHGLTKTYITTAAQVGRAVAALLALPITAAPSPSPSATSLNDYANAFIYVKSFLLSQRDVLDAVQRATQTSDAEWTVENMDVDTAIEVGREVWRGEGVMHPYLLFGLFFFSFFLGVCEGGGVVRGGVVVWQGCVTD